VREAWLIIIIIIIRERDLGHHPSIDTETALLAVSAAVPHNPPPIVLGLA
jgi:hypothetical protein